MDSMNSTDSIDQLRPEITKLSEAFNQLVQQVGQQVAELGETARSSAFKDLEDAQEGVLKQSNEEIERLKFIIQEYKNLESNVALLEQLQGITSHLKGVVRDLKVPE